MPSPPTNISISRCLCFPGVNGKGKQTEINRISLRGYMENLSYSHPFPVLPSLCRCALCLHASRPLPCFHLGGNGGKGRKTREERARGGAALALAALRVTAVALHSTLPRCALSAVGTWLRPWGAPGWGALPGPLPGCLQGSFPSTGRLRCDPWLAFGARKCLVLEELAVTGRSPRRRSLWLRPEASRPSAARAWNN